MTPTLWLRDLACYSLQLALLIGAAGLLARLLPLRPAGFALGYWRALLLAALLLPIAQPWSQPLQVSLDARVVETSPAAAPASARAGLAQAFDAWPSPRAILWVLVAGVAARAAWLLLGFWTLGRLRRRGRRLEAELPPLARAQARLGVRAEFFSSDETDTPITFGLRRPAVLLPESVLAMEPNAQQAILCHELLHVRRRDWLHAVLEEGVRALLWFHPAVAWLVGRIQLSREQAVDRAVIAITESREDYVGALLAVARARPSRELIPATLFLRKGRLKQRLAEILEEGTMSKKRLITHLLASGCAVLLAGGAAVRLFPLEARAAEGAPIQVLRGGEHLLHRADLEYPRRAIEKGVFGDVLLELSLDETGQVQDARVLSGPDELRAAALRSVLRWHYGPPAPIPGTLQVLLQFTLPAEPLEPEKHERRDGPENVARQIEELREAIKDPGVPDERRERYKHQLAEREAQLKQLDHAKRGLEQELRGSADERRRMEEKLAAAAFHSREEEEHWKKELAEQMRGRHEAEAEMRKLAEELAAAAFHSREDEERLRKQLAEQKREFHESEADLLKLEQASKAAHSREEAERWKNEIAEQRRMVEKLRSSNRTEQPAEGRLSAIHAARIAPDALKVLLPQLGVSVGDALDKTALARIRAVVARFDEHIEVKLGRADDGGLILLLVGPEER